MASHKTAQERGYVAAWMRRERLMRDWTQKEASARMREAGYGVTDGYYRQMEAGPRTPGPEFVDVLKRLYGSEPEPLPEPEPVGDNADVVAAIKELTGAVHLLGAILMGAGPAPELDPESIARKVAVLTSAGPSSTQELPDSGS